jgi:hypothetical protein
MPLRCEAHHAVMRNRLVEFARRWLYAQRILIPADRRLRDPVRRAYADAEQTMQDAIHRDIPSHVLEEWRAALFLPRRG